MDDETQQFIRKPMDEEKVTPQGESHFGGISIRAWLALMISFTGCALFVMSTGTGKEVPNQFILIWSVSITYYFGQKVQTSAPSQLPQLPQLAPTQVPAPK